MEASSVWRRRSLGICNSRRPDELALQLGRNEEVVDLLDRAEPFDLEVKTRHSMLWLREALAEASGTGTVESMVTVAEHLAAEGEERLALRALLTAAVRCYTFKVDESTPAMVTRVAEQLSLPTDDATLAAIYALAAPAVRGQRVLATARGRTPEQGLHPNNPGRRVPVVESGADRGCARLKWHNLTLG
jgi:hypothetical protein